MTKLILACDQPYYANDAARIQRLAPHFDMIKVGQALREQPNQPVFPSMPSTMQRKLIADADKHGWDVMLDNKIFDVGKTLHEILEYMPPTQNTSVRMVTVHWELSDAAWNEAFNFCKKRNILVIAVTLLTDISEKECRKRNGGRSPNEVVRERAQAAKSCGADGIVCSGRELPYLHRHGLLGDGFLTVVPGVRLGYETPADGGETDERIVTPFEAATNGADYIVVGSSIWHHPRGALVGIQAVQQDMSRA